ncbi:MAG: alpha/beta fold hydrolase, partial [Isosphaeraceae bacterium]
MEDRQPSRRRKVLRAGLIAVTLGAVVWLSASFAVAYRLTHRSRGPFPEPTPTVGWGTFESVRLTARDGEQIGAWFVRGSDSGPSVLFLHGNGGSRSQGLKQAEWLAADGASVLLITLRAHGDSTGSFNDIGLSARLDVVAAVEFLERTRPGRPVVVFGSSLGSAAAAFASEELGPRVSGYILECPYRDLKTAVWNRTREHLPAGLNWLAYQGLVTVAPLVIGDVDRIAPVEAVGGILPGVPVLVLAGGRDPKARPEEAQAIR